MVCCIKARQGIFLPWEHKQRKPEVKTTKTQDKRWIRVYQAVSLSPMDLSLSHGSEVYQVMGGRLHQPSILTQDFLIIIIVVIILTSPVTATMNSAPGDDRRQNESSAESSQVKHCTRFASLNRFITVGVLVQPLYVALMRTILLDGTSSAWYALQVLTRVLCSVGVSASLIHMALISGERFLAMRRPFAHLTLVAE